MDDKVKDPDRTLQRKRDHSLDSDSENEGSDIGTLNTEVINLNSDHNIPLEVDATVENEEDVNEIPVPEKKEHE